MSVTVAVDKAENKIITYTQTVYESCNVDRIRHQRRTNGVLRGFISLKIAVLVPQRDIGQQVPILVNICM